MMVKDLVLQVIYKAGMEGVSLTPKEAMALADAVIDAAAENPKAARRSFLDRIEELREEEA